MTQSVISVMEFWIIEGRTVRQGKRCAVGSVVVQPNVASECPAHMVFQVTMFVVTPLRVWVTISDAPCRLVWSS